jgi:hypothetical protein
VHQSELAVPQTYVCTVLDGIARADSSHAGEPAGELEVNYLQIAIF